MLRLSDDGSTLVDEVASLVVGHRYLNLGATAVFDIFKQWHLRHNESDERNRKGWSPDK